MSKLIPLNDTLIIKLAEAETKSAGGIVMTGGANAAKNRAVVVAGSITDDNVDVVKVGDVIIFNEKAVLATVSDELVISKTSVLAKVTA